MCHGLNHTVTKAKGCPDQVFAVTGSCRPDNARPETSLHEFLPECAQPLSYRLHGIAIIRPVVPKDKSTLAIGKDKLGSSRTGIYAQKKIPVFCLGQTEPGNPISGVLFLP